METKIKFNNNFRTENYHKGKKKKQQIIIGNSLRFDDNHIYRLKNKDFGKSYKWPTFTIKRNGLIYQHFNDSYYSDFIGKKDVDSISISILLENMGWLRRVDGVFYNWINEPIEHENEVGKKKWQGYDYWQKYPIEQIDQLKNLLLFLCDKHEIHKSVIGFHHYHKAIKNYEGVVLRSNHIDKSTDSNPFLDLDDLGKFMN